MAHLAQNTTIGAGDSLDRPSGPVRVHIQAHGRRALIVNVLRGDLAVGSHTFEQFRTRDEPAFAMADRHCMDVARLIQGDRFDATRVRTKRLW